MGKSNRRPAGVTRRKVLATGAGIAAATSVSGPLILTAGKARAAGKLYLASYGGTYGEALDEVFFKPFTKETGIEVVQTAPADLAKLKAQSMSGSVEWDVVEMLPTETITATNEGLLLPIDYSVVQMGDLLYPQAKQPTAASVFTYTGGIGYDKTRHPDGKHPGTFADFWNVQKFPGRRGLRSRPNDTLEIAILASGTDPKNVYPIDVDKAFKMLDEIKPHIRKWIETAPQSVQLIQTNELDFTYTFNGRVFGANQQGIPLGYSSQQLLIFFNQFTVPKGAKNPGDAMKLINSMMRPERQAAFCEKIAYPPVTKKGMEMVSAAIKKEWVPDPNNPKNLAINSEWWGAPGRFAELTERFKKWMLT
ncbi:MAG: ABC transporter substrate-binding protein [Alphaproteobacteria bacterium]